MLRTDEDRRAFLYDAGSVWEGTQATEVAWTDTAGRSPRGCLRLVRKGPRDRRPPSGAVAIGTERGSLVVTPPPHQFFFPRDYTDNVHTVWDGPAARGLEAALGFGIRQDATGGGAFVPWFNAPPGTEQRLGVFLPAEPGRGRGGARARCSKYTHGDRFRRLPGSRHVHQPLPHGDRRRGDEGAGRGGPAETDARLRADVQGHGRQHRPPRRVPRRRPPARPRPAPAARAAGDVRRVPPALRRRSSCSCPARRPTRFLGISGPGSSPGHWMSLFPKPVYWTMDREPGQPFVEEDPEVRHGLPRRRTARTCPKLLDARARPGLDGPPADQGLELGARRLPRRGLTSAPTPGSAPRGRRCPPTSRARGSASAGSTCSTTWPTGARRNTCPARWTSSSSTTRTSSTAT